MTQPALETSLRRMVAELLPDADVTFDATNGLQVTVTAGGEAVCVVYADAHAPDADVAVHVANVVQAAAIERLGVALPPCPGHAHPAVARVSDREVAWVCPDARAGR